MSTLTIDHHDDGTALLTIARPEKRNAMSREFFRELPVALAELDHDPRVVACVLTGAGEAFSAGGDIEDFDRLGDLTAYRGQVQLALGAFQAIERCRTVVIAAVNGLAYGGGTEITLASDLALAGRRARFAFREITLGLVPGYGLLRGPEVVGPAWTRWLALTGDAIDAEQARSIGLVQQVVDDERLLDEALAVARRIASGSPTAVHAVKRFLGSDLSTARRRQAVEVTALLFDTPEHKDRIDGFLRRRERAGP